MYSNETIKKYVDQIDAESAKLQALDIDSIKACVSVGNSKIGRALNVSTPAVRCCGNCSHCSKYCYEIKAGIQYKNTVPAARARNWYLIQNARESYFKQIREKCRRRRSNKFFRWHVSGDIIDTAYFSEMVSIAREYPAFTFWTYTKMFDIVNAWIHDNGPLPDNMHVMFSMWDGMETPNPYNMPVFACRLKDGNKDISDAEFSKMYKCPGNCDICKAAGRGCCNGESAYADEH